MKKILIIGATSAIAHACARNWAGEKAAFFLVGRNTEKLAQAADDLRARGAVSVDVHALDMNDFDAHGTMLDACYRTLTHIDVALIAHGTLPDQQQCEQTSAHALKEFSSNGLSVIAVLTDLANRMEKDRHGTIAVISSVAGERGRPTNYLYGSAKAAVTAFCEGLRARMFKVGVHVLTIKPGFVDTPMTQGLPLPGPLVASAEKVAAIICKAVERKSDSVYAPHFWALIMLAIRNVPTVLFKRLNL